MDANFGLAWLIPLLPFAAFAIVGIFTQRLHAFSSFLVIAATAVSCAISWMIFFQVMGGAATTAEPWQSSFPWLALSTTTVLPFGILIDPLAAMMLVVVTTVSLLVQVYSRGYLWEPEAEEHDEAHGDSPVSVTQEAADTDPVGTHADAHHGAAHVGPPPPLVRDPAYGRFFAYLGLFTAAMLGLVLANNLLVIYMFWEGVGLGSYLLIGFWYSRIHQTGSSIDASGHEVPIISGPAEAAKKAFVTTRFGDFGFLLGILWLWWNANTLEFTKLTEMAEHHELTTSVLTVGCLLLFMGAVGKSAQFPLHVWLPDAMEGPTPVSALIHAATMVAAGVYLVGRTFPLFEQAPAALLTVAFIGGFTAIFAASMGLVATDIKRVMAFSPSASLGT